MTTQDTLGTIHAAKTLHIYSDGACKGNPGKAGSGMAVYIDGSLIPVLRYGAYMERGTNNAVELDALHEALTLAHVSQAEKIVIFSDSKYSIDCVTKWAYGWKSKGWTKKDGEIKNLKIIQNSHVLYEKNKHRVEVKHVKGHAGIEGNELADRMAGMAISKKAFHYAEYEYESIRAVLSL